MVKGAVKSAAQTAATGSSSASGVPRLPQMGTGLNVAGNPVDSVENVHHVSYFPQAWLCPVRNATKKGFVAEFSRDWQVSTHLLECRDSTTSMTRMQ